MHSSEIITKESPIHFTVIFFGTQWFKFRGDKRYRKLYVSEWADVGVNALQEQKRTDGAGKAMNVNFILHILISTY